MPEGINKMIFGMFLFLAALQDGKSKTIHVWLLVAAALAGGILCFISGSFSYDRILSCFIGILIVFLSRMTHGAIGAGDGWFFTVSGLFLSSLMNLSLLVYGVFLSGFFCGGIYFCCRIRGTDVRKVSVPFLPFLVPVWIGLVIL
ncbi:prepilin peptidase [Lacrimispora sp. JR3]|uniref:prepilin peptidase n=1 Tax=Lacrimispora sinapis TaxID=3111456 RepID=UPI00374A11E9